MQDSKPQYPVRQAQKFSRCPFSVTRQLYLIVSCITNKLQVAEFLTAVRDNLLFPTSRGHLAEMWFYAVFHSSPVLISSSETQRICFKFTLIHCCVEKGIMSRRLHQQATADANAHHVTFSFGRSHTGRYSRYDGDPTSLRHNVTV